MTIGILGAGAFGTALGVALALDGRQVRIWTRDSDAAVLMQTNRENLRLPGVSLPPEISISANIDTVFACDTILLATPAQTIRALVDTHAEGLRGKRIVVCAKGIDLTTLTGPATLAADQLGDTPVGLLTGPSFADDIARGLPTALTLAWPDTQTGAALQLHLSTKTLRLYRTTDVIGAELGGALKNVIAIACGTCIGAGYGASARAALMTRGFAEMQRLAAWQGARADTLMGLSGLGDLALTCTSDLSRNYRLGLALGRQVQFDSAVTVEGAATAKAVSALAQNAGIDMPVCTVVAALVTGSIGPTEALQRLFERPLKEE